MDTRKSAARWTWWFVGALIATLLMQMALPMVARLITLSVTRPRGDGTQMLFALVVMMALKGLPATTGMIILSIAGVRRAKAVGEGWLTKALLIVSALATIPFFSTMVIVNPLDRFVGFGMILLLAFGASGLGPLFIVALRLRRNTPWDPRHPRIAMTIVALAILPLILRALYGIMAALTPIAMLAGSQWLAGGAIDAASIMMSGGGWTGAVVMTVISLALHWMMFTDDEAASGAGPWAMPPIAFATMTTILIVGWQMAYPTSTLHRFTAPASYARNQAMQRMLSEGARRAREIPDQERRSEERRRAQLQDRTRADRLP